MSEPALAPDQAAALSSAKALADAGVTGAQASLAGLSGTIATQQSLDNGMAALYDYNDGVIIDYELEVRYKNGMNVQNPVTEADLLAFVEQQTGARLQSGTNLTPTRIPQFDGSPVVYVDPGVNLTTAPFQVSDENELAQLQVQDFLTNLLTDGFSYPDPTSTITTAQLIGASSTSVSTSSVSGNAGLTVGNWLLLEGSGQSAVIQISSVNAGVSGLVPITIGFQYVVPPSGIIQGGATIVGSFPGFTNTERSSKTASVSTRQTMMDYWVAALKSSVTTRQAAAVAGLAAYNANGNSKKSTIELQNLNATNAFMTNYLTTVDISDTGINSLKVDEANRKNQIPTRIGQIAAEITAGDGSGSFYDRRYSIAVSRTTLGNGSLYVLQKLIASQGNIQTGQANAQALSARWASFM